MAQFAGWTDAIIQQRNGTEYFVKWLPVRSAQPRLVSKSLSRFFPTPTRSHILRAYPARLIRAFGHACTWMNLDASELEVEKARNKNVHAAMFSSYKDRDTIKDVAGCGPIGETFDGSLAQDGNCGSLSDSLGTKLMNLLDCAPYEHAVNVDKGLLLDNMLCAEIGIGCTHPPKNLKKQVQQSAEDTTDTQKVGNTRLVRLRAAIVDRLPVPQTTDKRQTRHRLHY
jgi:hypothetical protein